MIVLILPDLSEEDQLLHAARQGSQDAVMQIYNHYFTPIYQFIRLRVEDIRTAEDIASDVFLRLVVALRGDNAPHSSLRGWLFQVARNELYQHYGRTKRLTSETLDEWVPASTETDPETQYLRGVDRERTRQAIRMLAEDQQEVVILRFGQSLSLQETADIMGKSVSAIKSLQFRAVNTLRNILGQMQMEQGHG
jgi:RNA polymerase sigma-70 factor (ECF subfamily)